MKRFFMIPAIVFVVVAQTVTGNPGWAESQASDFVAAAEGHAAGGDSLSADQAMQEAYGALWDDLPLFIRRFALVETPAAAIGVFDERSSASFAAGEPLRIYVEPGGYGFESTGSGYEIRLSVDVNIVAENGATLWGQKDLQRFGAQAGRRIFEYFETLTFDLTGLPAGRYTLEITVSDLTDGSSAPITIPFEIAGS